MKRTVIASLFAFVAAFVGAYGCEASATRPAEAAILLFIMIVAILGSVWTMFHDEQESPS